ncbi:MAG TPA: acyl-protein synthetase [Eoetvoesiella sp.]
MYSLENLNARVDHLLSEGPYPEITPDLEKTSFELFRDHISHAANLNSGYANYVSHWPIPLGEAGRTADLPWLPVSVFKRDPPFSLIPPGQVLRTLLSSATTGQNPSRISLDRQTALRMNRGVVSILRNYIGSDRRPYLVVDIASTNGNAANLGARAAAIRALAPFATSTTYALRGDDLDIDQDAVDSFREVNADFPVIIYGFTSILWANLIRPLLATGQSLGLRKAIVLHSGGWKRLEAEAVSKQEFNSSLANVVGCGADQIIDYYGMVENLGIIYPDCSAGNKHAPVFGSVIVRDPMTLQPVPVGSTGLVQVGSILPTSFPGHLLLTDDLATVVAEGGCSCGRPGIAFRFSGRVPKAEVRGCGNLDRRRVL